jgi:hypothetical protein
LLSAFYINIHSTLQQSIQNIIDNPDDSNDKLFFDIIDADIRIALEKSINDIKNSTNEKNKDLKILLNSKDGRRN